MKKLFFAFSFVFAACATASAQEYFADSAATGIRFGARAGVNVTNVTGDISNNSTRIGYHGGAFAKIPLRHRLFLQPELSYSNQGYKQENSDTTRTELNYLNLPVLLSYNVFKGLSVEAGPYAGFRTETRINAYDAGFNIHNRHKALDFGIAAGLHYELPLGLGIGARYQHGLADITRAEGDVKTQVIQVSATYLLK